jgi:hypothetical protein
MAITIQQSASILNMANADLLYEVTSNVSTNAQYQYITVLKDGCNNTLTTVKQQPNPSNKGVFNLGRLVKQYLGYDANASLFNGGPDGFFQVNQNTAKFFKVVFGEEFGTSTTSSVNVYNGITTSTTGSPAFSGSTPQYYFINGVLDPNSGDWNWDAEPRFYDPQITPSTASFTKNVCLTDSPRTQYARSTDYLTVSTLNGNYRTGATSSQDIYNMKIEVYYTGAVAYSESYNNVNSGIITNGGPRTNPAQLWSNVNGISTCTSSLVANVQTSGSLLINMPIGPQNITNYGNFDFATSNWDYYTVKLHPQAGANNPNTNATWDTFTIYKAEGDCAYNGKRFAFINNYGVWDWYTFTLADSKEYTFDRGIYQQSFVNYSTTTNNVVYDISRRGNNAYYTNIDENFTVNSDWVTQEEADWLEQLFYSPNVYVQDGFNMLPIVVTTANLLTKSNPRTQKNFQYLINYQLANPKRSR